MAKSAVSSMQIVEGIRVMFDKAEEQMSAAKMLIITGSHQQALPHLNIALESFGQVYRLIEAAAIPRDNTEEWEKFWHDGKDHKQKLRAAFHLLNFFVAKRAGKVVDLEATKKVFASSKFSKEWAFYPEFEKGSFIDKSKSVSEETVVTEYSIVFCLLHEMKELLPQLTPEFVVRLGTVIRSAREMIEDEK